MQRVPNWILIVGPIVGAVLLFFVVNAMVDQLSADRAELAEEFEIQLSEGDGAVEDSEVLTDTATVEEAATDDAEADDAEAAPAEESESGSDSPEAAAGEVITGTETLTETGSLTDTEAMMATADMTDTEAVAPADEITETAALTETAEAAVSETEPITATEAITETESATETADAADAADAEAATTAITVDMYDLYFGEEANNIAEPPVWTVPSSGDVNLTLDNLGSVEHNWALVELDAEVPVPFVEEENQDILIYDPGRVQPGESLETTFTAPDIPGEYMVICTVPGHYPVMQGRLIVE